LDAGETDIEAQQDDKNVNSGVSVLFTTFIMLGEIVNERTKLLYGKLSPDVICS
jgi:hypothetical protein